MFADRADLIGGLRQVFNLRQSAEVTVCALLIIVPAIDATAIASLTDECCPDAVFLRTLVHDGLPASPKTRVI